MKRILVVLILAFALGLVAIPANAVTTCTATVTYDTSVAVGTTVITVDGTASTGGVIGTVINLQGRVVRVDTQPAAAPNAPTTLWDWTLTDSRGTNVILGYGADRSAAITQSIVFGGFPGAEFTTVTLTQAVATGVQAVPFVLPTSGAHVLAVTNAGSGKKLKVRIYCNQPDPLHNIVPGH